MGFAQAGVDPFPSVVSLQRGRPLLLFQGGEKLRLLPGSQQVLIEKPYKNILMEMFRELNGPCILFDFFSWHDVRLLLPSTSCSLFYYRH